MKFGTSFGTGCLLFWCSCAKTENGLLKLFKLAQWITFFGMPCRFTSLSNLTNIINYLTSSHAGSHPSQIHLFISLFWLLFLWSRKLACPEHPAPRNPPQRTDPSPSWGLHPKCYRTTFPRITDLFHSFDASTSVAKTHGILNGCNSIWQRNKHFSNARIRSVNEDNLVFSGFDNYFNKKSSRRNCFITEWHSNYDDGSWRLFELTSLLFFF